MLFILWTLITLLLTPAIISRLGTSPGWLSLRRKAAAFEGDEKIDRMSSTSIVMRIVEISGT